MDAVKLYHLCTYGKLHFVGILSQIEAPSAVEKDHES